MCLYKFSKFALYFNALLHFYEKYDILDIEKQKWTVTIMVRREIKSFELKLNSGSVAFEVPFSLAAARFAGMISEADAGESLTFSAVVYADSVALSMKHIYLKCGRFSAPCEVSVNGTSVGKIDGERLSYIFDVVRTLREGENKLSFSFSAECDPRTVGIFSPVEIIRFNNAIIDKVSLSQKHEDGTVTVGIRLDMMGNTENVRAVATLTSSAGQIYYAGLTKGRGSITVRDPLYWWPHGHGVQNLYKLTVNLYGESDIEDSAEMRIGLRTVETAKSVDGSTLTVNGVTLLPFGAVYEAEPDLSAPNLDKMTDAFITYAAMANYNTLVIPCTSPRPTERFYDACDAHGIMVIEELCAVSDGCADTLERSAHHPSLALLEIIDCEDIETVTEKIHLATPELAFSIVDRAPKYVSHPALPTEKCLDTAVPEDEMNLFSRAMERISDIETSKAILCGIAERYPYPGNTSDLVYISGLASANLIASAIKEKRLAEGNGGRAVFGRLCDFAPTASSSAMDSLVKRKPLQHYAHKFFAPITLYAENDRGKVLFSASSQRKIDFSGTVEYRISDSKNVTVFKSSEPLEFDGMSAKKLFTKDLAHYIRGHECEYYLEYALRESDTVIYSDVLLFVPEKHFKFEKPDITCEISGTDKKYAMTVTSKSFAKDVEFSFVGFDAVFSENYVNLTQNSPTKFTLNITGNAVTADMLKDALRVRSLYDVK